MQTSQDARPVPYWKQRRALNREKYNEYQRKYANSLSGERKAQHRLLNREGMKRWREETRLKLFDILGGAKCCCCGFSDTRALQFDHKSGGGTKEVKLFGCNSQMFRFYVKNPEIAKQVLQVLCANCNSIKRHAQSECYYNTTIKEHDS